MKNTLLLCILLLLPIYAMASEENLTDLNTNYSDLLHAAIDDTLNENLNYEEDDIEFYLMMKYKKQNLRQMLEPLF